ELEPLSSSFKRGWTSGLLYIGAIIPLAITIGPLGEKLTSIPSIGEKSLDSIDIVVWIPTLMITIAFILGRKNLPKTVPEFMK
ncbi:C4-dicarboxylate ABC transporter permease, partial [Staphylococcus haemolyticus]